MRPRLQPYGNKNISGANIERIRKERGMQQYELAAQMQLSGVDINVHSLSKLEGQVRLCKDYELLAIANILHVSVVDLLCGPGSLHG